MEVNLDLFLGDLKDSLSRTGPDRSMFIGQILLFKKNHNSNDAMIIDGQQRFVTLNILLCGMRDILQEGICGAVVEEGGILVPSGVIERDLYDRIQKLTFTEEGAPSPRLALMSHDIEEVRSKDYKDLLYKVQQKSLVARDDCDWERRGKHSVGAPVKNKIKIAKTIVRTWLDKNLSISEEPAATPLQCRRSLGKLLGFIEKDIHCTDSTAYNYGLAYRSFYTINSRGIDLTPGELIRASLAARAKEIVDRGSRLAAQERIRNMLSNINDARSGSSDWLSDFFEYYYRSTIGGTSNNNLAMDYWNSYISKSSMPEEQFIQHIRELCTGEVENYCKIRAGHNSLPANRDLFDLNRQKLVQNIPMLLAFMRRNKLIKANGHRNGVNRRKFEQLVKFIGIYFVRCKISPPDSRPDEKEWLEWAQIMNSPDDAAKSSSWNSTKRNKNLKKVLTELRKKAGDRPDNVVENDLKSLTADSRRAKYIFRKLGYFQAQNDGEMQVEHILPKAWSESWGSWYNPESHKKFKERLGNLTILEENINNEIKNESWAVKKRKYPNSTVTENKDLALLGNWRQIRIKERQERLARLIVIEWAVPPPP